ncbi:hypothetical protein AUEXF2481DRAFT_573164 [Aureobasidium subglaciale EXF-2481]|uniref:Uncharacterized protein n=1 Tax=Aureobasidium subglaciale (strain EXF-2481) TaxID=1043005 RepID=A0A074YU30_AURSE|nr:uncharacterized protein AUEXF2481DRAFT_573164 [Aureobasidium subglaciale EXF-2481]KAI5197311.1 hypothetical protein E4T38_08065 [Aureobasidium subglaciale]KAI5216223.1 hypothetical protein E4T40_08075 [Aureobasidium subglaciale]KAI5219403.1 hypothetical protein E4T41_07990 [Aureobasidium subglaciale]KAI5256910.1 hypothetical protein E4T46_07966 [Aureobasidium subglaciale]KEQ90366.1 hypothetical protein AUEXF2481DRAFT_573164 [Aureobasidium subglaciale EXF-2481]
MYTLIPLVVTLFALSASAAPSLEARKNVGGAPTGGPASAKVTIYSSYTCAAPGTVPPTDGSAGTATTFTIAEGTCTIPTAGLIFGGALTASLTAVPKTGTVGCYVLGHSQQGCGITLTNNLYGWPFSGTALGNSVGCGNAPSGTSWGAFEVLCV